MIEAKRIALCFTFFIFSVASFCQMNKTENPSKDSLVNINVNEFFELTFHYFLDGECIWVIESDDTASIKLISKTKKSPKSLSDTLGPVGLVSIGGGFDEIWKFTGIQKGVYQLRFYYKCQQPNGIRMIRNIKVVII
jgi:hypothetical protein